LPKRAVFRAFITLQKHLNKKRELRRRNTEIIWEEKIDILLLTSHYILIKKE